MGYWINLEESTFVLRDEHKEAALEIVKALNAPSNNHLKRGGSWGPGTGKTQHWFSWMPADYDKTVGSIEEVFELLGFILAEEPDGAMLLDDYDSKTGQEDLFLGAIAHLVEDDTYVQFVGEDGDRYRYVFKDGKMTTKHATLVWED